MKQFRYTITDPAGIHARPAGMLVKAAKTLDSAVTIQKKGGPSAGGTKLMAIMALCIKCGDEVIVTAEGGSEDASIAAMEKFFKDNL